LSGYIQRLRLVVNLKQNSCPSTRVRTDLFSLVYYKIWCEGFHKMSCLAFWKIFYQSVNQKYELFKLITRVFTFCKYLLLLIELILVTLLIIRLYLRNNFTENSRNLSLLT
jgi:hypothetical protein